MELVNATTEELEKELACRAEQKKKQDEEIRLKAEARANNEKDLVNKIKRVTGFVTMLTKGLHCEFGIDPQDHNIFIQTKDNILKYLNETYLPHRLPGFIAVEATKKSTTISSNGVVIDDHVDDLGIVILKKEHFDACAAKGKPQIKPLINKDQAKRIEGEISKKTSKKHKK